MRCKASFAEVSETCPQLAVVRIGLRIDIGEEAAA